MVIIYSCLITKNTLNTKPQSNTYNGRQIMSAPGYQRIYKSRSYLSKDVIITETGCGFF